MSSPTFVKNSITETTLLMIVTIFFSAKESGTILGLEVTWFVVVVISTLLVLLVLIVLVSICVCRGGWNNTRSGNGSIQQQNAASRKYTFNFNFVRDIIYRMDRRIVLEGNVNIAEYFKQYRNEVFQFKLI